MELRQLGKTDLRVSALGFGAVEINGVAIEKVNILLQKALDAGLNVIDTAECYGNSEELIGRCISHRRNEYYLFTKCGHSAGWDLPDWNLTLLEKTFERSLKLLKTDWVDLLFLHTCSEEQLRQGDVIEFAQKMRKIGKARYIGYSGDHLAALYAVECGSFDVLETSLSIADQQAIDLTLPLTQGRGMGVVVKRPVANACWRTRAKPPSIYQHSYWNRLQALGYDFLREDLETAIEIALRFTLMIPGVHTAIVGTANIEHWYRNLQYLKKGPLTEDLFLVIRSRWNSLAQDNEWVGER